MKNHILSWDEFVKSGQTISQEDLARFHRAARMIEDDLHEAYYSCRRKFGPEIAGVLLVAALRNNFNSKDKWPPDDSLIDKVNNFLVQKGIVNDPRNP